MEPIDLSRELFHRTQVHPSHPPAIVSVWGGHSDKKIAGNTVFTSNALSIALSDHAGTHPVGRGRFRFIGFPLKIRGGTASPIRAVAVFG